MRRLAAIVPAALAAAVLWQPVGALAQETPDELSRQIARLEGAIAELDSLAASWRERDTAEAAAMAERTEERLALASRLDEADDGSAEVEAIFDAVRPLLLRAIPELRSATRRMREPSEIPPELMSVDRSESQLRAFALQRDQESETASRQAGQLEELIQRQAEHVQELQRLEATLRERSLDRHLEVARDLYLLRLEALDRLPAATRERVFSVISSEQGREEAKLEWAALRATLELQSVRARGLVGLLSDPLAALRGALGTGRRLLEVLLVVVIWRWARSRQRHWLARLRTRMNQRSGPRRYQRTRAVMRLAEATVPWVMFLLALALLWWWLDLEEIGIPFVVPMFIVLAWFGAYRLSANLLFTGLVAAAESAELETTPSELKRLRRGVNWVLGVLTAAAAILASYAHQLGEGVLYAATRRWGFVAAGVVLLAFIAGWRRELADLVLAHRARGRFADLVRKHRDRWTGALVAPLSFGWLLWHALVSLAHGVASSFAGTRGATTYLSRRRIEKHAETVGYASGRLEDLPPGVSDALDEHVTVEDLVGLNHFPGLAQARESAAAWRDGQGGGSFLLAGETGLGKSAWVDRFVALESAEPPLVLDERVLEPNQLARWLGDHLVAGNGRVSNRGELVEALLSGPPRIVVLGQAENLFLATVNGYRSLAELAPLVDATRRRIFWLFTMEGLAWNHLSAARKRLAFLRKMQILESWEGHQIAQLLDRRGKATGLEIDYSRLMGGQGGREDRAAHQRRGKQAYEELMWDVSGGNPKVALHYFARSLEVRDGSALHVLPFRTPDSDELLQVGDPALYLLASVARHGQVTLREAARATDYDIAEVEPLLARLVDLGAVGVRDDRFRINIHWQSTVLRLLRRRNVLIG